MSPLLNQPRMSVHRVSRAEAQLQPTQGRVRRHGALGDEVGGFAGNGIGRRREGCEGRSAEGGE